MTDDALKTNSNDLLDATSKEGVTVGGRGGGGVLKCHKCGGESIFCAQELFYFGTIVGDSFVLVCPPLLRRTNKTKKT